MLGNATMQAPDRDDPGSASTSVLFVRGLTKVYGSGPSAVHALQGVDLDLYEGEMTVLLGASGSGKSTLLNIIGGLDAPTEGIVEFRGRDLSGCSDRELTRYRRDSVGFVFQFYNLIASLTAEENVSLVTEIANDPMSPADALEMVGLADRRHHFPSELSGGEQQRVAIARAIAKRPDVLLCDEPTGALDSKTGILVLEAIDRINRQLGATTALITHNMVIADMAHRSITMVDGQIAARQTTAERLAPSDLNW